MKTTHQCPYIVWNEGWKIQYFVCVQLHLQSQGQLKSIGMTSDGMVESNEQSFDSEHSLKNSDCNNFIGNVD